MRAHALMVMAYLALVLVLGGASAAAPAVNLALQLAGAGLLAWSLSRRSRAAPDRRLRVLAPVLAALVLVQLLPVPFALWRRLPGREAIAHEMALAGSVPDWMTLSLSPWHGLASLACAIPALALFVAVGTQPVTLARDLARVLLCVAIASVLLALAQDLRGAGYIYAITNYGSGTGFFANANHQADFLLVTLVWTGGDALLRWRERPPAVRPGGWFLLEIAALPLLIAGILIAHSLAVDLLLLGICGGVALAAAFPRLRGLRLAATLLASAALVVALLLSGRLANDLVSAGAVPGISRADFLASGLRALRDFAPVGSGLGTFERVYHFYEDPAQVGTTFVNHAHNDLLELLIETGGFGAAAVLAFGCWFVPLASRAWRRPGRTMQCAATIIVAIELVHSLVDYPLRTAALSALAAIVCAVLRARHHEEEGPPGGGTG